MADTFELEIVTPTGPVLSAEVETVVAPGTAGEFGVLKGHSLFMTPLDIGRVSYVVEGRTELLAVGRGFAEVLPHKTTILVETAVKAADLDTEEAKKELAASEEALSALAEDDAAYSDAADALELARAKVQVAEEAKE